LEPIELLAHAVSKLVSRRQANPDNIDGELILNIPEPKASCLNNLSLERFLQKKFKICWRTLHVMRNAMGQIHKINVKKSIPARLTENGGIN